MQKKFKWISYYLDSAHQLSAPAFSCLCLSSVYCVTHSCNDWWKQQKQHGRAVMVRGGCELQRIRYVSFHLWVLKICQYKLVGSPSQGCIEHQKKLLTGRAVQYWKGLPREVVQSPSLDVLMTWLDKATADLLGAGNSSVLSRMLDYRPPEVPLWSSMILCVSLYDSIHLLDLRWAEFWKDSVRQEAMASNIYQAWNGCNGLCGAN